MSSWEAEFERFVRKDYNGVDIRKEWIGMER